MSDHAGAAKRRRDRRLRSWLRHERMTVAMELTAALQHSCGTNNAPRGQKSASSVGTLPGVLEDPGPAQVVDRLVAPLSPGQGAFLSLGTLLGAASGEAVDARTPPGAGEEERGGGGDGAGEGEAQGAKGGQVGIGNGEGGGKAAGGGEGAAAAGG